MAEWQPIETAPRDGTKFMVTDGIHLSHARWPKGYVLGTWEPRRKGEKGYSGMALGFEAKWWAPLRLPPQDAETEGER